MGAAELSTCWWEIRCRGFVSGAGEGGSQRVCENLAVPRGLSCGEEDLERIRTMVTVFNPVTRLASQVEERLLERNQIVEEFFAREAPRLAEACRLMSERFLQGGRLLAFGRGPYATDAQHVSVEFVHPVIVGKRALPALDISMMFGPWLETILHPEDIVMGFGPPEGDDEIRSALRFAQSQKALTFSLPGTESGANASLASNYAAETHT